MIRELSALDLAKVRVLGADQKESGLWGRDRVIRGKEKCMRKCNPRKDCRLTARSTAPLLVFRDLSCLGFLIPFLPRGK